VPPHTLADNITSEVSRDRIRALWAVRVDPAEWVVVLVTGDDLKAVGSTVKTTGGLHIIEPTVEVLQEAVDDLRLLSE
jgi:hypothetical protein